uniref:Uncharacterized protein n=1 Tax=Anguilla anguilla TaxID=7936 RepID=A0A0E9RM17_ANGAN
MITSSHLSLNLKHRMELS